MMLFISGFLFVLAGLSYAAGERQLGAIGNAVCRMGPAFCEHPGWLLIAAIVVTVWAFFLRVDTL
jgi:hypothetical protein